MIKTVLSAVIGIEFLNLIKRQNKNLEARKISFVQEFLKLQNEEIIDGLEKLLRKQKAELLESGLKPMSLEQFNAAIDQSLNDVENERIIEARTLKDKVIALK